MSNDAVELIRARNPHSRFIDMEAKGHLVLDVTADRVQSDFIGGNNVNLESFDEALLAS